MYLFRRFLRPIHRLIMGCAQRDFVADSLQKNGCVKRTSFAVAHPKPPDSQNRCTLEMS
jgi:hypothetical protein